VRVSECCERVIIDTKEFESSRVREFARERERERAGERDSVVCMG
jgi:ERCC4-type nuclease